MAVLTANRLAAIGAVVAGMKLAAGCGEGPSGSTVYVLEKAVLPQNLAGPPRSKMRVV